ncbi:MAG: SNF2-related protein [Myxococcota bacterium]
MLHRGSRAVPGSVERVRGPRPAPPDTLDLQRRLLRLRASSDLATLRCLSQIRVQPYEYQKDAAVQVMSALRKGALIADDVGLGKTIEAGMIIAEQRLRGFARRVLIVSPPGVLLEQLRSEMRDKFGLDFRQFTSQGDREGDQVGPLTVGNHDLVIVSQSLISRGCDDLLQFRADLVVVDECHHFTNHQAARWKNLRRLTASAKSVVLMSATPFRGDPEQLWALFTLLDPGLLGAHLASFREAFVVRDRGRSFPTPAFKEIVAKHTVRRRRTDIGGGIPFPGRDARRCPVGLSPAQKAFHQRVAAAIRQQGGNAFVQSGAHRQLASSYESLREGKLRERLDPDTRAELDALDDTAHPKVRALLDDLLPRLPADEKVLLFSHFRASQRALVRQIAERGIPVVALSEANASRRVEVVRRFRDDPDVRVLVCGEGAGEGLNLQFCSLLVNFDLPWNPMKLEQRIGRIQRLGQRRKRVSVVNLVLEGTIEDRVLQILTHRLEMFRLFMGETEQVLGKLLDRPKDGIDGLEAWIASLVLENGALDDRRFEDLGERIASAREQVREEARDSTRHVDTWIGNPGSTSVGGVAPPSEDALDLAFLGD